MKDNIPQINFGKILSKVKEKKIIFLKVWVITFILSCIWIFPQPRYYQCEVSIAPESDDGSAAGGMASLASSFGINLGNMQSSDAIYPELYPDLFESTDFIVDILDITVTTSEDTLKTDYYTYLTKHQKPNILTLPLFKAKNSILALFKKPQKTEAKPKNGKRFNPFQLSEKVSETVHQVQDNITCKYSKTTSIVTITVTDQDPVACAIIADSVKERLQDYITAYRTRKARLDCEHYEKLVKDAKQAYDNARHKYSIYADTHTDLILASAKGEQDDLENEMQADYQLYTSMNTQLEASKAKLQEMTPAFVTLKCATVPIKPAGPKRVIFVLSMLILSTFITTGWLFRKELKEWF